MRQLRLVVQATDFDEAVAFYRDVLGLPEEAAFEGPGDARVVILVAGRATLEIANLAQAQMIDEIEVGRKVSRHVRVAFEVDDAELRTQELLAAGATELAPVRETPCTRSTLGSRGVRNYSSLFFRSSSALSSRHVSVPG